MKVELQPAYTLHSRAYRDTSALVDFFTADYGRVTVVVRGVYGKNKKNALQRAAIQPHTPLIVSWFGRGDLKTLTAMESVALPFQLGGQRLYCAFYVNELLTRLLPANEAHQDLFPLYTHVLRDLAGSEDVEVVLRRFEFLLMESMGYLVSFERDCVSAEALVEQQHYLFRPDQGFTLYRPMAQVASAHSAPRFSSTEPVFFGADLQAIWRRDFSTPKVRAAAKKLMRYWLGHHLGDRPLKSRAFFINQK
jgi:DNA repair protein RecO (recombination protein O)